MGRDDSPSTVRRATCLVGWFDDSSLVLENYLSGRQSLLPYQLLPPIASLTEPATHGETLDRLGGVGAEALLEKLVGQDVLLRTGSALDVRERSIDETWSWGRDARYFHFSTRRTSFDYDLQRERDDLVERALATPQPPAFKDYGGPDVELPDGTPPSAGLVTTLEQRRTGRDFTSRPITRDQLAAVLRLTWGVTEIRPDPGVGMVALKTSPSGGARHPVEVYCVAQNVEGLDRGVYHYCAGRHILSRLPTPAHLEGEVLAALTQQPWVSDAAAVFWMTAVTERSAWKYPQSHAYRVLLLDAGHLGQTFHLVCTALGLAPWTSAAIDEDAAQRLLSLEDPGEIVLYAAACGWRTSPAEADAPTRPRPGSRSAS